MTEQSPVIDPKPAHKGLSFALDFGPLLIFFLAFKVFGIIIGTAAFMAAIVIAVVVSKWKLNKISPMLWMSAILVLGFGTLTIYFNDQRFIQIKPTIIYLGFAAILGIGLLRGKPMLKYLLQAAFEGLSDEGWLKLSRNWMIFFAAMAGFNEIIRNPNWFDFDTWLTIKVWGVSILSFVFAMANIPMLIKHGLAIEEEEDEQIEDEVA